MDKIGQNLMKIWSKLVKIWSKLVKIWSKFVNVPIWCNLDKIGQLEPKLPKFDNNCLYLTKIDHFSPKMVYFDHIWLF